VERRKLLVTAGALSVAAFATTLGVGANLGLFGLTQPESPVGRLDARQTETAEHRTQPATPASTTSPPRPADD
jgi:hypothetical protein